MPELRVAPDLTVHYEDHDFADPWRPHEAILLLHGFAESSRAWFAWVPHLARRYRVLLPDLRGFGRSTVPSDPERYPWSATAFAEDTVALLDALELPAVHLVGARVGAAIALQLAADHPDRVLSLSLVSGLVRGGDVRGLQAGQELVPISSFADRIRRDGLAAWVAQTASARLGSAAAAGLIEFWTRLMAGSDERVCIAMMRAAARVDVSAALERVVSPTLVIASESSRIQDLATVRAWQRRLARSELFVLPGDSPHLAATAPDKCAERVLSFTLRVAGHAQHVSPAMAPGASATKLASTNRLDR